jgi:hypothetical protein
MRQAGFELFDLPQEEIDLIFGAVTIATSIVAVLLGGLFIDLVGSSIRNAMLFCAAGALVRPWLWVNAGKGCALCMVHQGLLRMYERVFCQPVQHMACNALLSSTARGLVRALPWAVLRSGFAA